MQNQPVTEPMGFLGMMWRAVRIGVGRAHYFILFGVLQLLVAIIGGLIGGFLLALLVAGEIAVIGGIVVGVVIFMVANFYTYAFIVRYTLLQLRGVGTTAGQILKTLRGGVVGRLLGTGLLSLLVLAVGYVLLIVPGIILMVYYFAVPAVVIEENLGYRRALRRSMELVRGRWWYTAGALICVLLVVGVMGSLVSRGIGLVLLGFGVDLEIARTVGDLLGVVVQPFQYIAPALLYHELRVHKRELGLISPTAVEA